MSLKQNPFISLVKYPILTEKTIQLLQSNQYSFAVDKKSNKDNPRWDCVKTKYVCEFENMITLSLVLLYRCHPP